MSEPMREEDCLRPSVALLSKLGSIAIHAEEFMSSDRHEFDLAALRMLLEDPEVLQWRQDMGPLLPVKRVTTGDDTARPHNSVCS